MEAQLLARFPVRLETRPGRGRCLVAARDLEAGETVLACAPAATLPFLGAGGCCNCATRPSSGGRLLRCGACKRAVYCDRRCQVADWRDHKAECSAWPNVATLPDVGGAVTHAVLAGRVFRGARLRDGAATAAAAAAGDAPAAYVHCLADVLAMERDESPLRRDADAIAVEIARSNGLLPVGVSDDDVRRVVSAFERNNFSVTDDLLVSRAAGCYPAGALLNHSCAPNCTLSYEDYWLPDGAGEGAHVLAGAAAPKGACLQVIRTLARVPAGGELLHSYVEIARPREERQRQLLHSYGFRCACELCAMPLHDPRCPERFLETRSEDARGEGGGGKLPQPSALAPAGAPDPAGGAGHIHGGVPAAAAIAIKSARVLLQAVETGPPPPADASSGAAARSAGRPQQPQAVHLTDALLARVAAENAPQLLAAAADGAGAAWAPPPRDAPPGRCVLATPAASAQQAADAAGAPPPARPLLWRYEPTRGAITSLGDGEAAGVRLELTALEAAVGLLVACGQMHPLGLDVFAATQMAWSRYLLLEDLPLAAVAGESMCAFYDAAYVLCPQHPMSGLHLFSLADTYRTLHDTVRQYASTKRGGGGGGCAVLLSPARASALAALHTTAPACRAVGLLSQPLSAGLADALRARALECYDRCSLALGLWVGAAHPMPAKARALAAELRGVASGH